jgi:hypothetical protein
MKNRVNLLLILMVCDVQTPQMGMLCGEHVQQKDAMKIWAMIVTKLLAVQRLVVKRLGPSREQGVYRDEANRVVIRDERRKVRDVEMIPANRVRGLKE